MLQAIEQLSVLYIVYQHKKPTVTVTNSQHHHQHNNNHNTESLCCSFIVDDDEKTSTSPANRSTAATFNRRTAAKSTVQATQVGNTKTCRIAELLLHAISAKITTNTTNKFTQKHCSAKSEYRKSNNNENDFCCNFSSCNNKNKDIDSIQTHYTSESKNNSKNKRRETDQPDDFMGNAKLSLQHLQ
ncbi:PREDICTED: homeobox protein 10-like [Rhagoletis zephyria]|uniref:homeobox protein 10-like n=1 Tax=Rhagoletis zephyria TaxID=28612 RepID=UPI0008119881|nr:PREDICTED: homeobox protein 10-like [Rhagoletis zephyria]